MFYYRAHWGVHAQNPPDSLWDLLNVMHVSPAAGWVDQYAVELGKRCIAGPLGAGSNEAFLRIVTASGLGEGLDLAERYARQHPSDRMRFCAWTPLAAVNEAPDAVWGRAEVCRSRLVEMEAKARLAALQRLHKDYTKTAVVTR